MIDRLEILDRVNIAHGSHQSIEDGACAMELVSYLAGEPFSASPKCASPLITSFVVNWNDAMDEDAIQLLERMCEVSK